MLSYAAFPSNDYVARLHEVGVDYPRDFLKKIQEQMRYARSFDCIEQFSIECRKYSGIAFIGFALLRSVIGLENSRHPLNQSDAKVKPIATWSLALPALEGGYPYSEFP